LPVRIAGVGLFYGVPLFLQEESTLFWVFDALILLYSRIYYYFFFGFKFSRRKLYGGKLKANEIEYKKKRI